MDPIASQLARSLKVIGTDMDDRLPIMGGKRKIFTGLLIKGSLSGSSCCHCQGRSQPRRSWGAPASGRWARGWVRINLPFRRGRSGGRDLLIFLYIFNTKSCILMHSLAPKMGITSVFINTPMHWGKCRLLGAAAEWDPKGQKSRPKTESGVGF